MKKSKRLFSFFALIFVVAMLLATTCFAWANIPISSSPDTYSFAYKSNTVNTYTVYAWSYDGITYAVMTDDRYFNANAIFWADEHYYIPVGRYAPSEETAQAIVDNYLASVAQGATGQAFSSAVSSSWDTGYNYGYNDGYEEGKEDINDTIYNEGYTDGATDSGFMKNTLITIFSSPYYILNEVFNFELFGVSVSGLIMFVMSIILVGFVIKLIL